MGARTLITIYKCWKDFMKRPSCVLRSSIGRSGDNSRSVEAMSITSTAADSPLPGTTIESVLTLRKGEPGGQVMKEAVEVARKATYLHQERNSRDMWEYLRYGNPTTGHIEFRTELAKLLSKAYGDNVGSDDLMLTAGASHGLLLVSQLMFGRGATVFLEDPSYFFAVKNFQRTFNVVPVKFDDEGMNVEDLEQKVHVHKSSFINPVTQERPFSALVYLMPTFHNPTGVCLAPDRCRKLIQVARKHNLLLFCDDVYNLLHYTDDRYAPARLLAYDDKSHPDYKGNVMSNGSFSKILGPGMRAGWIEADTDIIGYLARRTGASRPIVDSGGATNHFVSGILERAMSTGMQWNHILNTRKILRSRMESSCEVLRNKLPEGATFIKPHGGYFIWIKLSEEYDIATILDLCKRKSKLQLLTGIETSSSGDLKNYLRLSISYFDEPVLLEAMQRLCAAITESKSVTPRK